MLPGALAIRLLGLTAHASFIIAAAAASAPGDQAAGELVHRCGTAHPSKELVDAHEKLEKNKEQHKTRSIDANEVINIDMYMHVVLKHQDNQVLANATMLNKLMDVLNKAFEESKFHFNLKNISRTNNATWAVSWDNPAMRRQLRQGDQKTVNAYILSAVGRKALGAASLPDQWGRIGLEHDYVDIAVDSIVGGSDSDKNEGITLVHEVGHWLGLLHPHEYGCDTGDFIDDTPAMAQPDFECTRGLDSCPGAEYPGEDPIHNYMSYGPDSCLTNFTLGQTQRMRDLWETFRLFKNEKEISWKDDCEAAFIPLYDDCMGGNRRNEGKCQDENTENIHLPCTPLSPRTKRECLDRFAPYRAKCKSDSCKVDFVHNYERYCAAELRVKEDADKQWRLVCRQASTLVQEQCTKCECRNEMASGSLFKRCEKTPQDGKQCEDVLDPLVKLCETDQCRRGLEALKSKECAARKDPVAEYNGDIVTDWDRQELLAPMTRDEWATLCNEMLKAIIRSCKEEKECIKKQPPPGLTSVCQGDRPKTRSGCKNIFIGAEIFNCRSNECRDEVVGLKDKACAGISNI
ncbi:Extracellular metalloprotease [Metarhizium anisopliae]|nr:Extracellular metalloprotease [Metarhizium anisopliae]